MAARPWPARNRKRRAQRRAAGGAHGRDVAELDTTCRSARANRELRVFGALDAGNGGVFEYDTRLVPAITAVDLFLDQLPAERFPPNVTPRTGDALELAEPDASYDGVLHALLYHHLVGADPEAMVANVRAALAEAERVLEPGGRLVVAESCVPGWFYPMRGLQLAEFVRLLPPQPLAARSARGGAASWSASASTSGRHQVPIDAGSPSSGAAGRHAHPGPRGRRAKPG
jgi:SAM-dependent methyltransferase